MGKTTRWFKRLVARIRSDPNPKDKRTLAKSYTNESHSRRAAGDANLSSSSVPEVPEYAPDDAVKHAIAVAAASAAAAEAALAAAQAAAAVVRLTASGRCYAAPPLHVSLDVARENSAALLIQSQFRGYLARRALRALKGLVKLQAHVRGHITRRKTAETMRSLEAMLRAQVRARSLRGYHSPISSDKSSQIYHHGPPTPEKLEMTSYSRITSNTQSPTLSKGSVSRSINRVIIHPDNNGCYLNSPGWSESQNDESIRATRGRNLRRRLVASCSTEEDKILEIDTGEQQQQRQPGFCTAENSPRFLSAASSRRQSPTTPTKSDASAASCCLSGYSDCPSYMAYTESSRAKVRASSAPRQRPRQQCNRAATRACFASKACAGSGRLSLGMPIGNNREV